MIASTGQSPVCASVVVPSPPTVPTQHGDTAATKCTLATRPLVAPEVSLMGDSGHPALLCPAFLLTWNPTVDLYHVPLPPNDRDVGL